MKYFSLTINCPAELSTATGKKVSKKHIHMPGLWSKRYAVKGESYILNKYKTVYSVITDFIITGS